MDRLVRDLRMLSGLSVACGNARRSESFHSGMAREVRRVEAQFLPATEPITDLSLYDLASLTKLFTAIAVMQLVEEGRLSLDDRVGDRDDRFPGLRSTSLHDALCYLAVLRSPERVDSQPDAEAARRQVFQVYRDQGPEPERLYSDMNALVLKYLVERASGRSFYQVLEEKVLRPCGMGETYARVPKERLPDCLDYGLEHRLIRGEHQVLEAPRGQPHDPKARLLQQDDGELCGHAGLFSSLQDMVRLAQGLLRGALLKPATLMTLGLDRTGRYGPGIQYRQFLGYLCFSKSPVQRFSELPAFMGTRAIGLSGYTGNHFALDPELGVFDIFLGNRCHNRLAVIEPPEQAEKLGLSPEGAGSVLWPDGRQVHSSWRYIHLKDALLHRPIYHHLTINDYFAHKEDKYAEGTLWTTRL